MVLYKDQSHEVQWRVSCMSSHIFRLHRGVRPASVVEAKTCRAGRLSPWKRRLMPMVCLDWFVAASSDEQGQKVEGATDVFLLTDTETGYVAAIPAKSKSAESHPHLVEMGVKFLGLMRHER